MNDEIKITQLLRRLDRACARMNTGLSAVAAVLAIVVSLMGVIRASQYTAILQTAMTVAGSPTDSATTPLLNPWTYN